MLGGLGFRGVHVGLVRRGGRDDHDGHVLLVFRDCRVRRDGRDDRDYRDFRQACLFVFVF